MLNEKHMIVLLREKYPEVRYPSFHFQAFKRIVIATENGC